MEIATRHLKQSTLKTRYQPLLVILISLGLQSCISIQLINPYDELTEQKIIYLQEQVASYFVQLEHSIGTPRGSYENFEEHFYTIKVALNTLEVRAAAFDKNTLMQEQIGELTAMVKNLEALHKSGLRSEEQLTPLKNSFNTALTAMIRLQLALKRAN